jgi:hypothetical protein
MGPIAWLAVAALAAIGAYLVGWPAWQARRDRLSRDTNTERYLAWRGRASEAAPTGEGWTSDERRRLVAAGVLALLAAAALVGFFVAT